MEQPVQTQPNGLPAPLAPAAPLTAAQLRSRLEQILQIEGGEATIDDMSPAALRALAAVCREGLTRRWAATQAEDSDGRTRRVHYLSMEFLMGRALANALDALGMREASDEALGEAGTIALAEHEADAALGNGGLGRLAACFLDSMATLGLPSFGYGLRYRYGMFAQHIRDGRQMEEPDQWLRNGDPWSVQRHDVRYPVGFGGKVQGQGRARQWLPAEAVEADAFDFIVPGHGTQRVSTLRLWQARAIESLDFAAFSRGEHHAAAASRARADALTWVLYPDDSTHAGRELRLKQEFFLVSASLQDIIARHVTEHGHLDHVGDHVAIHLNDTHPALAVPELMRLLIDERGLSFDSAWTQAQKVFSYTNHTLMPEALETWPVRMVEELLPRHMELIYEINHRFLAEVRQRFNGDDALIARVSIIDENGERRVRMAPLSIIASHKVNGVSQLHSELMVQTIFADYARIFPGRFTNVTNGVTPRRWLAQANRSLSRVIDEAIGPRWRLDLDRLADFARFAGDRAVRDAVLASKQANKQRLAERIRTDLGILIDADSLFDVQIKRMHEYKRQLLNLLRVVASYQQIIARPDQPVVHRTVLFAGKAASAYVAAKNIIRLIHDVARVINSDPRVGDKLKLVFVPNYSVSVAERMIPAAELSEQLSTAGTEASGTGNMKFALNGALTIGTWDGANIEIAESVGAENIFIFGLRAPEVARMQALGYDPRLYYEENAQLKQVLDAIGNGAFSPGEPHRYRGLVDGLLHGDRYLLLADFASYLAAQAQVDRAWLDPQLWAAMAIRNIAGMGRFSTDRTIRDYARLIWNLPA
jgi:glycogen phosphorylase